MRLRLLSRILLILTAAGFAGCNEDETLSFFKQTSLYRDLNGIVTLKLPSSSADENQCVIENGLAAVEWYDNLDENHRTYLKTNISHLREIRFTKTEILHGKAEYMAGTFVHLYDRVLIVNTRGVETGDDDIVCQADIKFLKELAVDQSFSLARAGKDVDTQLR